jgi:hypothetical protein
MAFPTFRSLNQSIIACFLAPEYFCNMATEQTPKGTTCARC